MDAPAVEVCDKCVGAHIVVTRRLDSSYQIMLDVAARAYERGYRHGKEVSKGP